MAYDCWTVDSRPTVALAAVCPHKGGRRKRRSGLTFFSVWAPRTLRAYVFRRFGHPGALSLRFPMFLRVGRSELTKINVSEPRALSLDACAAKSPARDLGTFFVCGILGAPGLAGNH